MIDLSELIQEALKNENAGVRRVSIQSISIVAGGEARILILKPVLQLV